MTLRAKDGHRTALEIWARPMPSALAEVRRPFITFYDDSGGMFVAPGTKPTVVIHNPAQGGVLENLGALILDGSAEDLEDGLLGEEALVWTSDRDGALGTGSEVYLNRGDLARGTHIITLAAADSEGMTAETSVEIILTRPWKNVYMPLISLGFR